MCATLPEIVGVSGCVLAAQIHIQHQDTTRWLKMRPAVTMQESRLVAPTLVNGHITDAVTQANVKVLADAPVYQTLGQTVGLGMQNATAAQQLLRLAADKPSKVAEETPREWFRDG
jgi:DNA-directed RNA polymerase beta subunit